MNQITKVRASQLRYVSLAAITIDPSIQQRVDGTSKQVVEDYAEAMRTGDEFPPPIVFSTDGTAYHLGSVPVPAASARSWASPGRKPSAVAAEAGPRSVRGAGGCRA
jgi:hypothetical protein